MEKAENLIRLLGVGYACSICVLIYQLRSNTTGSVCYKYRSKIILRMMDRCHHVSDSVHPRIYLSMVSALITLI